MAPRLFIWVAVVGWLCLCGGHARADFQRAVSAFEDGNFDEAADEELRRATEQQIEEESTAQYATGRLWDDGIIDPRETRTVLAIALTAVHSAPVRGTAVFGVVRH